MPYQRILIATDGSTLSEKAVDHGLALAELCDATAIALKVVPRYPRNYFEGGVSVDIADVQRIEQQWNDAAQALVDAIQVRGKARGITVKAVVSKSDLVAEAIIAAAKKHKADLIVMASHGRKGVKRMLMGSETQHVLTHSHIPVLVLR